MNSSGRPSKACGTCKSQKVIETVYSQRGTDGARHVVQEIGRLASAAED